MTQEKEKFEAFVHNFCKSLPSHGLGQAISYALQGGKRFRALLTLSVSKDLDLDEKNAYKIALAIEIFHQVFVCLFLAMVFYLNQVTLCKIQLLCVSAFLVKSV